ncbi:unknown [Mycoplasma sp. CAG:611]|nr:unknown [Mycoplasma sp. CAG:611]
MNMNLNYYDACYKICALSTILGSSKENVVAINDNLIAKTKFTVQDGGTWSDFKIVFLRDGKIIEEVTFDNNADKALKLQRKLLDDNYAMELRLQAMEGLTPSLLAKFLKNKPMLTSTEMASVIAKADEMEALVLEQTNQKHR